MVSISLCLITFNEEKVVLRCLNSLLPIIDYYIVVDTNSSDRTKEIIKDFFDSKGIKGEIYDAPNFHMSENLNFAFKRLKGKADFAFYIDSDNVLSIPENTNIENMKKQLLLYDSGEITVDKEDNIYAKKLLYNLNKDWIWLGALHETATCKKEQPSISTPLKLIIHNDGNSWTSQTLKEKYLRHASIILKDIEADGLTSRNVFYLAQSYRDAGEKEKAIQWYAQRLGMTGFYEEVYMSQLNIAQLKWELNYSVMEVADEFMKCGELDELRAEHLLSLKFMYERNKRPNSAKKVEKLLSEYHGKNPYPNRVLFLNPQAYETFTEKAHLL